MCYTFFSSLLVQQILPHKTQYKRAIRKVNISLGKFHTEGWAFIILIVAFVAWLPRPNTTWLDMAQLDTSTV